MKRIYIVSLFAALLCMVTACNNDEDGIKPSNISNLRAISEEGRIILKWDVPADSALFYVQVTYQSPTGEVYKKNTSVYQDVLLIDGLLAKDGEYTFNVCPISTTNTLGEVQIIKATALPVQPVLTKKTEKIDLAVDNVSSNKPDPEQGDIAALVNGSDKDFFHSDWHNPGTEPHYIDIALPKPVEVFEIKSWYRGGSFGQCPLEITVLGSNDKNNWIEIGEMSDNGSGKTTYTTPVLGEEGKQYNYIRYRADLTSDNNVYFALAEMEIYKVWYDIYDPEGIYHPEE